MSKIMLIDDEPAILNSLQRLFHIAPCRVGNRQYVLEVECFTSPEAALARARHEPFDLFLTDYRMPEMDGVAFLRAAREIQPDAARLILSGYADIDVLLRAVNEIGIDRFLGKPWNDYELVSSVGQCLFQHELLNENRRLADLLRMECGDLSPQELEARRLETLEPGITKVNWGTDGSVLLETDR